MTRLLGVIVAATIALGPGLALASYQSGWDPNDAPGRGDIRVVSVRIFRSGVERWLRVLVRTHTGPSDYWGEGIVRWKLDGRGGRAPDHWITAKLPTHRWPRECHLSVKGRGAGIGRTIAGYSHFGCVFPLDATEINERPRFRALVDTTSDGVRSHDVAPNRTGRWYR